MLHPTKGIRLTEQRSYSYTGCEVCWLKRPNNLTGAKHWDLSSRTSRAFIRTRELPSTIKVLWHPVFPKQGLVAQEQRLLANSKEPPTYLELAALYVTGNNLESKGILRLSSYFKFNTTLWSNGSQSGRYRPPGVNKLSHGRMGATEWSEGQWINAGVYWRNEASNKIKRADHISATVVWKHIRFEVFY